MAVRSFHSAVVDELLVERTIQRQRCITNSAQEPKLCIVCDCMLDESACTCELVRIAEQPQERHFLAKASR